MQFRRLAENQGREKRKKMKKELEIGENYGDIFGLDFNGDKKMIYKGDDNWLLVKPGAEQII
jgi:hypothetical protein